MDGAGAGGGLGKGGDVGRDGFEGTQSQMKTRPGGKERGGGRWQSLVVAGYGRVPICSAPSLDVATLAWKHMWKSLL